MRKYKENKEKLRRRKIEDKRRKIEPLSRKLTKLTEGLPIVKDTVEGDTESDDSCNTENDVTIDSDLLKKLTSCGSMVDELDVRRKHKDITKKVQLDNTQKIKLKHKR